MHLRTAEPSRSALRNMLLPSVLLGIQTSAVPGLRSSAGALPAHPDGASSPLDALATGIRSGRSIGTALACASETSMPNGDQRSWCYAPAALVRSRMDGLAKRGVGRLLRVAQTASPPGHRSKADRLGMLLIRSRSIGQSRPVSMSSAGASGAGGLGCLPTTAISWRTHASAGSDRGHAVRTPHRPCRQSWPTTRAIRITAGSRTGR